MVATHAILILSVHQRNDSHDCILADEQMIVMLAFTVLASVRRHTATPKGVNYS